jgi:hypothetical protein
MAKAKKAAKRKSGAAPARAFKIGQRVEVTHHGSFALGCKGTVELLGGDGKTVSVMLDHKKAASIFPAAHLAPL